MCRAKSRHMPLPELARSVLAWRPWARLQLLAVLQGMLGFCWREISSRIHGARSTHPARFRLFPCGSFISFVQFPLPHAVEGFLFSSQRSQGSCRRRHTEDSPEEDRGEWAGRKIQTLGLQRRENTSEGAERDLFIPGPPHSLCRLHNKKHRGYLALKLLVRLQTQEDVFAFHWIHGLLDPIESILTGNTSPGFQGGSSP